MDAQQYSLRSFHDELKALAKSAASRNEDDVAGQLEDFHDKIEHKYLQMQQENIILKDELEKLKAEHKQLQQNWIEYLLKENRAVGQQSRVDRVQDTQTLIPQIIKQHPVDSTLAMAGAVQAPVVPWFYGEQSTRQIPYLPATSVGSAPPSYAYNYGTFCPPAPPDPAPAPSQHIGPEGYNPKYPLMYDSHAEHHGHTPRSHDSTPHHDYFRYPITQQSSKQFPHNRGSASALQAMDRPQKRRRDDSGRPNPVCRLCYVSKTECDSCMNCLACQRREARCSYEECKNGESCGDTTCVRLHPLQREAWMKAA